MSAAIAENRNARVALMVAMCAGAILILDGFDIQVIGLAAPAIVVDLGIDRAALAPALAAAIVGMTVGAAVIGMVGDRWGRRPALILSTMLFGATTLLGATATSVTTLGLWRFAAGLGLGGALPAATALLAEFWPRKSRAEAISATIIGVPIGAFLAATLAAELIPAYGWRAIFVVGGALPLLAAGALYFLLPESPEHAAADRDRGSALRALGAPALRWDTIATALVFLTSLFAVYAFFNWSPLVLTSMGFDIATSARGALVFNIAGVPAALANARLISRFGSRWPLAAAALIAAIALAALAWVSRDGQVALASLMVWVAIAGAAIGAVQGGMYAVAAHVFPTECRASGVGCATGAGRLGGIIASFAGGSLLALGGAAVFFAGVGGVLLLTLVTVLLVRRHISPSGDNQQSGG
jgi:MFS transporter, AAHS family, 4-hydroxybenzoate transporter